MPGLSGDAGSKATALFPGSSEKVPATLPAPFLRLKLDVSIEERSGLREKLSITSVSSSTPDASSLMAAPITLKSVATLTEMTI